MSFENDIFISYNKSDQIFAEKLVERIERESHNGKPLKVWYAPWDIDGGDNIVLKIEDGLKKSRHIGIIMSPEWNKSAWTKLERSIAVYEDPANLNGKIIPMLLKDCEIPPSLSILKCYDFRIEKNFEREVKKLITKLQGRSLRLNQTISSLPTLAVTSDIQDESIVTNIFPILQLPKIAYQSKTKIMTRGEIWLELPGVDPPPFAGPDKDGFIFSFFNPAHDENLKKIVQSSNEVKVDSMPRNQLIELLNRCLTRYTKSIGLEYDYRPRIKKNFLKPQDDETKCQISRYEKWTHGTRRVVHRMPTHNPFYAHQSFKAQFVFIHEKIFLRVIPGWHFTDNGIDPVDNERMASFSARWLNRERNHSVLDHLRFWADVLSKSSTEIIVHSGSNANIVISSVPLFVDLNVGIEGDYRERMWHEDKTEEEIDDLQFDEYDTVVDEEDDEI